VVTEWLPAAAGSSPTELWHSFTFPRATTRVPNVQDLNFFAAGSIEYPVRQSTGQENSDALNVGDRTQLGEI